MNEILDEFMILGRKLIQLQLNSGQEYSTEEDDLVDEMDILWKEMSQSDRAYSEKELFDFYSTLKLNTKKS